MNFLYTLVISIFLVGCGGSSSNIDDNSSLIIEVPKDDLDTPNIEDSRLAYSNANYNELCKDSNIFSLYPSLRDVNVQVLDYVPSVHSLGSGDISVNIFQYSSQDNSFTLNYNENTKSFTATCIPVIHRKLTEIYSPFKIEINDLSGKNPRIDNFVTLFESDETNCMSCHKSNGFENAKPKLGWSNIGDTSLEYKLNILRLHDEKYGEKTSQYIHLKLPTYNPLGLEATAQSKVINCTDCHHIMAIAGSGAKTIKPLTSGLHKVHLNLIDPYMANISKCVTCHPSDKIEGKFMGNIMHKRGLEWVKEHSDATKNIDVVSCKLCHGYNFNGSGLSKVQTPFNYKTISYENGDSVSCLDCHTNISNWDLKDDL